MNDEAPPQDRKETPSIMGAMPGWAAELMVSVKSGFQRVDERLQAMDANIDLQGDTVRDVAKRMTALEERQNALEARANTNSERAKSATLTDEKHDAAIAMLHTKIDENTQATQAVKAALTSKSGTMIVYEDLKRSPHTPRIIAAIVAVLLAALGYATSTLKSLEHKVEHPPAQVLP